MSKNNDENAERFEVAYQAAKCLRLLSRSICVDFTSERRRAALELLKGHGCVDEREGRVVYVKELP